MHHYLSSRLIYFTQLISIITNLVHAYVTSLVSYKVIRASYSLLQIYIQVGQDSRFKKNRVVVVVEDSARWHLPIEQV